MRVEVLFCCNCCCSARTFHCRYWTDPYRHLIRLKSHFIMEKIPMIVKITLHSKRGCLSSHVSLISTLPNCMSCALYYCFSGFICHWNRLPIDWKPTPMLLTPSHSLHFNYTADYHAHSTHQIFLTHFFFANWLFFAPLNCYFMFVTFSLWRILGLISDLKIDSFILVVYFVNWSFYMVL